MEYCQMILAEVISRWTWGISLSLAWVSCKFEFIDNSISTVAALVGLFAGIVWAIVLVVKLKKERIEKKIREIELQKLELDRIEWLNNTEI